MSIATLPQAAVGLMPAGHDPRPCVNKPAGWWDLGNKHNARAVRYCRTCPLINTGACIRPDEDTPRAQIRDGKAYSEAGKPIAICPGCDHPKLRAGKEGIARCACPPKRTREEIRAEARARREAANAAKLAARQQQPPQGMELVDVWIPLHCAGLSVREAAERLGVRHGTLKNALHRARCAGDRRVPLFRAARSDRPAA